MAIKISNKSKGNITITGSLNAKEGANNGKHDIDITNEATSANDNENTYGNIIFNGSDETSYGQNVYIAASQDVSVLGTINATNTSTNERHADTAPLAIIANNKATVGTLNSAGDLSINGNSIVLGNVENNILTPSAISGKTVTLTASAISDKSGTSNPDIKNSISSINNGSVTVLSTNDLSIGNTAINSANNATLEAAGDIQITSINGINPAVNPNLLSDLRQDLNEPMAENAVLIAGGNINMDSISAENTNVTTINGDINIETINANDLNFAQQTQGTSLNVKTANVAQTMFASSSNIKIDNVMHLNADKPIEITFPGVNGQKMNNVVIINIDSTVATRINGLVSEYADIHVNHKDFKLTGVYVANNGDLSKYAC